MYKRDFIKDKTVKTNDKIRCLGVVMTPLSRKKLKTMQITAFKICGAKINIIHVHVGAKIIKTLSHK